jgi:hypothetical protein
MDTSVWLGLMRSSSLFQSADSTQVTMPADPPQDHLDPHVLAAILRLQVLWYNSVTGHGQMFWKGTARSGIRQQDFVPSIWSPFFAEFG